MTTTSNCRHDYEVLVDFVSLFSLNRWSCLSHQHCSCQPRLLLRPKSSSECFSFVLNIGRSARCLPTSCPSSAQRQLRMLPLLWHIGSPCRCLAHEEDEQPLWGRRQSVGRLRLILSPIVSSNYLCYLAHEHCPCRCLVLLLATAALSAFPSFLRIGS